MKMYNINILYSDWWTDDKSEMTDGRKIWQTLDWSFFHPLYYPATNNKAGFYHSVQHFGQLTN